MSPLCGLYTTYGKMRPASAQELLYGLDTEMGVVRGPNWDGRNRNAEGQGQDKDFSKSTSHFLRNSMFLLKVHVPHNY